MANPYSVIVGISGSTIYAQDADGNTITGGSGVAGIDDSSVINAALSYLITGGVLFLKGGNYTISSTLTIANANTVIEGEGLGTKLNPALNVNCFTISAGYVTLEKLYINHQTTGTGNGMYVPTAKDGVSIRHCRLDNCYHAIQTLNNCKDLTIENNYIVSSGRADGAIYCANSSGTVARRLKINKNTILTSGMNAIQAFCSASSGQNWSDVQVSENVIYTAGGAGIFLSNAVGFSIVDNITNNVTAESVDFEYCCNGVVANNEIYSARGAGISSFDLTSSGGGVNSQVTVKGNKVHQQTGCVVPAIHMQSTNGLSISSNIVESQADGITLNGNFSDVTINHNITKKLGTTGNIGINVDLSTGKTLNNMIATGNRTTGYAFSLSFGSGVISRVTTALNDFSGASIAAVNTSVTPTNWINQFNQS